MYVIYTHWKGGLVGHCPHVAGRIYRRRSCLGDWEGDTVLGRDKRVRIVTFVDRKSGYLIAYLLPTMLAELLASLAIARFHRIPKEKRRTLTLDNGTEFSAWERIEEKTGMIVYFAHHITPGSVARMRIRTGSCGSIFQKIWISI
jgi:IS30 family transposase